MMLALFLAFAQEEEFQCQNGSALKYRLMAPESVEDGRKYPLVLCLHGRGGNTDAPQALMKAEMRKKYPCYILAPKVDSAEYSWSSTRKTAIPYVLELLDALLPKHAIDADRIYVTGQSMGGAGTFAAIATRPDFFAAAAPICGTANQSDVAKFKHVPIWIFHGDADPTVPVASSRTMVKALKSAGGEPKYTEYPGVKHNSWDRAYAEAELWSWMFGQKRKSP